MTTLDRLPATRASEPEGAARGDTWARRLLGPFHVTGIFWTRAIFMVSRSPEWFAVSMVWLWSCTFFVLLRRPRKIVAAHQEVVLGRCGFWERQRRIFKTFHTHAWCLVERFEQFRPVWALQVDFEGDDWQTVQAAKAGFIVATAHVGNWEMGQLMPVIPDGGRKLHVVREREEHSATQEFVEQQLRDHPRGGFVTHFLDDDNTLGATLLMALRRGDVVTLAADRPKAGMATVPASLFDRPISLPAGPLALARAAEVPLVPTFVFRVGRRHYRVVARAPIRVERSGDRDADLRQAASKLAGEVEWAIREVPSQWVRWEPLWPQPGAGGACLHPPPRAK